MLFPLLLFFVCAARDINVGGILNASTPGNPDLVQPINRIPLTIGVRSDGYTVGGRRFDRNGLRSTLLATALRSTEQNILAIVEPESSHGQLIDALDACAEAGLSNVSMSVPKQR